MKTVRAIPKLSTRPREAHKNDFGHVVVLAGSRGMTGAAALTCQAALRVGAGLVTLGIPKSLNGILEAKLTETMTRPLPETAEGALAASAFLPIQQLLIEGDVLAIGPGLSQQPQTAALARKVLARCEIPCVVDADGLNALAAMRMVRRVQFGGRAVLTPHPGEFERLTGVRPGRTTTERIAAAAAFAGKHGAVMLLKGHRTVVTDGKRCYENKTGNPGMATAGCGDVLAGIIAGALAQGMDAMDAAIFGAHVHGLAGDLARQAVGEHSVIASDLLEALPTAVVKNQKRK